MMSAISAARRLSNETTSRPPKSADRSRIVILSIRLQLLFASVYHLGEAEHASAVVCCARHGQGACTDRMQELGAGVRNLMRSGEGDTTHRRARALSVEEAGLSPA